MFALEREQPRIARMTPSLSSLRRLVKSVTPFAAFQTRRTLKAISSVLAMLFATCAPIYAQSAVNGTWRVEGVGSPFPWEVVLKTDASGLTGAVSSCPRIGSEIFDGHIDGDILTFTCKREDIFGRIAFTGRISGDGIAFTWKLQPEDPGALGNNHVFGPSAPTRFIAKRVPDGDLMKMANESATSIHGVEFAAAVNFPQRDMKVFGTLFVPQEVKRVRALIVVLRWGLGSMFYQERDVRKLLEATDAGLVLADFATLTSPINNAPRLDGADGLLMLLQRLAQESGHQEISESPLLFWGHSAATSFGSTFAGLHPERTIAFVRYNAGSLAVLGANLAVVSKIPGLFLTAGTNQQNEQAGSVARELWRSGRSVNAPWTFCVNPTADHGDVESLQEANSLAIPWIIAVLRQRLSPDGKTLRAVTDGSAWMGNNQTGEIAPSGSFPGPKADASWLPDEQSAQGWQAIRATTK